MVVEGYKQGKTGFPGVLETWIPLDGESGPIITFILKSDKKLQWWWRTHYPTIHPASTKKGPRAFLAPDSTQWLYVRLF